MADSKVVVGLDIGTSVIRVAIGEIDPESDAIQITGTASVKSAGLRNGVIVNIEDAKDKIKEAIAAAEQDAGIEVESVITGIGGAQIESQNCKGGVAVSAGRNNNKEITIEDVNRVIENATAIPVPGDREKLHVIPRDYIVDGFNGIPDPVHRIGTRLEAEVHIVTAAKTIIENIRSTISRSGYYLDGVILKTLAQTISVCHEDEMELGSILIDLGAGTTDVIVLVNGSPITTASIPVGGNLVTNDIAVVTGISVATAEDIKLKSGCCWIENITEENDQEVILPGVGGRAPEIMYQSQLCQIIQARMEQIFTMVKAAIIKNSNEQLKQLSGNIILTGGGAQMEGVVELAQNVFKTSSVRLGVPSVMGVYEEKFNRPDYATAIGLVLSYKTLLKGRDTRRKSKTFAAKKEKTKSDENPVKKFLKMFF